MTTKNYSVAAVSKSMQNYIEKNYEHLKETYLRKGYDSKILFSNYCIQMFEKDYLIWEEEQLKKQFQDVEF